MLENQKIETWKEWVTDWELFKETLHCTDNELWDLLLSMGLTPEDDFVDISFDTEHLPETFIIRSESERRVLDKEKPGRQYKYVKTYNLTVPKSCSRTKCKILRAFIFYNCPGLLNLNPSIYWQGKPSIYISLFEGHSLSIELEDLINKDSDASAVKTAKQNANRLGGLKNEVKYSEDELLALIYKNPNYLAYKELFNRWVSWKGKDGKMSW